MDNYIPGFIMPSLLVPKITIILQTKQRHYEQREIFNICIYIQRFSCFLSRIY